MTKFKCNSHPLFAALGIRCGHILIDGREVDRLIYNQQFGERRINKLFDQGRISQDDVPHLLQQMVEADIIATEAEMFAQIGQWEAPEDFVPEYEFRMHDCGHPLRHGFVHQVNTGIRNDTGIFTIFEALIGVCEMVMLGMASPSDCAHLLQQIVAAGLAHNNYELRKQAEAIPPEVRAAFEQKVAEQQAEASFLDLVFGDGLVVQAFLIEVGA